MPTKQVLNVQPGEPSSVIRKRVEAARARMIDRQGKENVKLAPPEIEKHCSIDETGVHLMNQAIVKMGLSGRAYHRILKVARTVADLADAKDIAAPHLAEAVQYRRLA